MPAALDQFKLPAGVNDRLQELLDRQDRGETLTATERREAEGLVDLADLLSLLSLRAQRIWHKHPLPSDAPTGQAAPARHPAQRRTLRVLPSVAGRPGSNLPH